MYSYVLLFGRDKKCERIGRKLGVDMDFVHGFRDVYSQERSEFQLLHFPIYGDRLNHIQKKMQNWRPQSLTQLFIRPYQDPLTYYGFQFASVVGIVTIIAVAVAVAQTYAAFEALRLQMEQMGGINGQ